MQRLRRAVPPRPGRASDGDEERCSSERWITAGIRELRPLGIDLVSRQSALSEPSGSGEAKALNYKEKSGGRDWDRTSDPLDVNEVLSR